MWIWIISSLIIQAIKAVHFRLSSRRVVRFLNKRLLDRISCPVFITIIVIIIIIIIIINYKEYDYKEKYLQNLLNESFVEIRKKLEWHAHKRACSQVTCVRLRRKETEKAKISQRKSETSCEISCSKKKNYSVRKKKKKLGVVCASEGIVIHRQSSSYVSWARATEDGDKDNSRELKLVL